MWKERLKKLGAVLAGLLTLLSGLGALFWMSEARKARRRADDEEFEKHKAEAEAERIQAEQGRDAALAKIEQTYQKELKALDEEQKAMAEKLRTDPAALSSFLVSAGRKQRARSKLR